MEHGSLTESAAASANLRHTYVSIAKAILGSVITHENGFDICVGPYPHPVCNFAVNLKLNVSEAGDLARRAATAESFNVYSMPGDEPAHLRTLLERYGFVQTQTLVQMVANGKLVAGGLDLERLVDLPGREDLARFMTDQFFHRQTSSFRRRLGSATARATNLELLAFRQGGAIEAGAMLSETEEMLGIYNVCVTPEKRGMGFGTTLIQALLQRAESRGKPATLQCEALMQDWYERHGFRATGYVEVFSLSKTQ
ncbi:hypothetical protein BH11ARM1_BH11ARM1_12580 [soil metagenome]